MTENKYPTQHVFVATDQLRKPKFKCNWELFENRGRKRTKYELIRQLVRHNMLNMKTINKALGTKSSTKRKAFARTLFPDINDFKRETWAFAYVGDGRFVYTVARQHDKDNFVRRVGRQKALGQLHSEIKSFEDHGYDVTSTIEYIDAPKKVLVEMKRMMSKTDPDGQAAALAVIPEIEDEDFAIPDNEETMSTPSIIYYGGGMHFID